MSDIHIRVCGPTGRITLTRPQALNAVTYQMCLAIEEALDRWRDDKSIIQVVIDAEGDRAFCAGGDIAELYTTGMRRDFTYGQKFWADEYRLNAKTYAYPKPVISFLQGFTMGGGVGIGCHGSHRIVGETSQIAMPECGIGLVPDVGGSLMLARAPGCLGAYLGTTAARMSAADAILAGFADTFVPQDRWPDLISQLEGGASPQILENASEPTTDGFLASQQHLIDHHFWGATLDGILDSLRNDDGEFAKSALKSMERNSPLSMACTIEMLHQLCGLSLTIEQALSLEYRFTYRAMEYGDFLEGIRAAIVDKDRAPKWQYADHDVPAEAVRKMLAPLGDNELKLEEYGHGSA